MLYDSDFLAKIKESINLVEYVTSCGIDLTEKRGQWWTSCVFHEEKTPSLMFDHEHYYCFACGAHGDIFTWLTAYEKLSFPEAVEKAAKLGSVDLSKRCLSLTYLFNQSLLKARAFSAPEHTILPYSEYRKFRKDYPEQWLNEGISKEAMDFFDIRFDDKAGRIVYPVEMINGDLIGIKGRTVFDYKKLGIPKYMNYYAIGDADFLQGLSRTITDVKKSGEVILFEGIKSCMKALDYGFPNTAAVETHTINPWQIRLLVSLGVDITVAFDSDVTYKEPSLVRALNTLNRFTNVFYIFDPEALGGASAKNSPADLGKETFVRLYDKRRRWTTRKETH